MTPALAISCSVLSPIIRRALCSHARSFRQSSSSASLPAPTISIAPWASTSSAATTPSLAATPSLGSKIASGIINDLLDAISRGGLAPQVWSHYTRLIEALGQENIPLEIHQQVLRYSTYSAKHIRVLVVCLLLKGVPAPLHIHQDRFRIIIRGMKSTGAHPTLDDYHFILEQFSVVGNHMGAIQVLKELLREGVTPKAKTFTLCLQAIVHRLTLPIKRGLKKKLIAESRKLLDDLMDDMRKCQVPLTSVNFDLSFRILKEAHNQDECKALVKQGYGIDLDNPDRLPLEYLESAYADPQHSSLRPFEFSTSALNTILDMLGHARNASGLIQAFEVLTQPLPNAKQYFFSSFDDENDFGEAVDLPTTFKPPHAPPNTASYHILLRHLGKLGHPSLVRHYIVQAMDLDRQTDLELRLAVTHAIQNQHCLHTILSPTFTINRGTLVPVLGGSIRSRNRSMIQWLSRKTAHVLRTKVGDLAFYTGLRERIPETSPAPKIKFFDINLHIKILERDIRDLKDFYEQVEDSLGRTDHRIKERLGRRIWEDKDVYVGGKRNVLSKEKWREIVRFTP